MGDVVRALVAADRDLLAEIAPIYEEALGRNCTSVAELERQARDPRCRVVAALRDDTLVGAASATLLRREDAPFYAPFGEEAAERIGRLATGSVSAVAVAPALRGMGLGRRLVDDCLAWLAGERAELAIALSWVSGGPNTSRALFEHAGFRVVGEVPEFYREYSVRTGLVCPTCGGPPCTCAAILFEKSLGGG